MKLSITIFCMICISSSCTNPTSFQDSSGLNVTPEILINKLISAYQTQNVADYISVFSTNCQFKKDSQFLWGIKQEEQIHERMFASVTRVDLELNEIRSEQVTEKRKVTLYSYKLLVELPAEQVFLVAGQVELDLVKDVLETWRIQAFFEIKDGYGKAISTRLTEDDNSDYLPLRVGNTWLYKNTFMPTLPEIRTTVTDSLMIQSTQYYRIDNFLYPAFCLNRLDSLLFKTFVDEDSMELTVLDFDATIGDSLVFTFPNLTEPWVVELISEKDSVTVPAGTFLNVKEFLLTDFNSGSRFQYEFAAGIGIIRQRGSNTINELFSAEVNGKIYPVVTGIKSRLSTWTDLKQSFY